MKNKSILLIVGLLALLFIGAGDPPVVTESLVRIQAEIPAGDVTAFFEKSVTVEGVVYKQPWQSVAWNSGEKTVTVNGETKTYHQVMLFVLAIAQQERTEQQTPPPPEPPAP